MQQMQRQRAYHNTRAVSNSMALVSCVFSVGEVLLKLLTVNIFSMYAVVMGVEESLDDGTQGNDFIQSYGRKLGVALVIIGFALVLVAIKIHFNGGSCTSKARLDGKTVIVTGANCGIGKAAALDFAQRGARTILACRNEKKGLDAAKDIIIQTRNKKVVVRKLDLSSFKSVREFAQQVLETEDRLDILVNNAGGSNKYRLTEDGFIDSYQVNYLSHFLLTLLLLEKLKESAPSRIVNVSSLMHVRSNAKLKFEKFGKYPKREYDASAAYNQTKLAQILFTRELCHHLKDTGVTVNALHPGAVDTAIWNWLPKHFLFKALQWIVFSLFFKNPMQGAQTTIHCAVAEELEGISGLYFSDCRVREPSDAAKDPGSAKKLWEVSEECTGVSLVSSS